MKKILLLIVSVYVSFAMTINSNSNSAAAEFSNPSILGKNEVCGFPLGYYFIGGNNSPYDVYGDMYKNMFNYSIECPTIPEAINSANLPNNEKTILKNLYTKNPSSAEVVLNTINFLTGKYVCKYIFNNGVSFLLIKNNNACSKNVNYINSLLNTNSLEKSSINPLPINNLGFVKFNFPYNWGDYYSNTYDLLKKYVEEYKDFIKKETGGYLIDIKKSLDSHTQYQQTYPSFLVGLITLSPAYINQEGDSAINAAGELNLKTAMPNLINKNSQQNSQQLNEYMQTYLNNFNNMFSTINKKFWGFYYYLLINLNDAVAKIIRIFFTLGTLALFSYATLSKKMNFIGHEKEYSFKFDFSKKFVGIVTAFFVFTAPVIPSGNIKISKDYLYDSSPSKQTQENYVTVIQGVMRYVWQTGNYFANFLNDYVNYSFLKYMEKSIGITLNPDNYIISFNNYYKNLVINGYSLINKDQFLFTYCKYSYPQIYSQYGYFPNTLNTKYSLIDNGYYNGIYTRNVLKKYFGIDRVDYKFCSALSSSLLSNSVFFANNLNSFYYMKNSYIKALKAVNTQNIQDIEKMEKTFIEINNKAGWLSTVTLPIDEMIFKTKNIFGLATQISQIKKSFQEQQNIYVVNINKKVTLENPIQLNSNSNQNTQINGQSPEQFLKKLDQEGTFKKILNFVFSNKISSNVMGTVAYSIFPGFVELLKTIYHWFLSAGEMVVSFIIQDLTGEIPILSSLLGGLGAKAIISVAYIFHLTIFLLSAIIAVILYQIFLSIVILIIILLAILVKIILYYLEMVMTFLLSYVIVLWALFVQQGKMTQGISQFLIQIFKVGFTPILIVFSMTFILIANNLINFIYYLILYIVDKNYGAAMSDSSTVNAGSNFFTHIINYMMNMPQTIGLGSSGIFGGEVMASMIHGGLHAVSFLVVLMIKIIADLLIIIKFSDWALEIIGYSNLISQTQSGIRETIKNKIEQKFGGNII